MVSFTNLTTFSQNLPATLDSPKTTLCPFSYETSNGIAADETGEVRNVGAEDEYIAVQGSFKYLGPDGVTYTVTYVADENGFQPQGDHLPTV